MKVKALKPCFYRKGRAQGEVFEADERFGYVLMRMGVVARHDEADAAEPSEKPKRTYKRRDLQAEGGEK